ncbi:MAG: response regulator [Deltaproteobacteria bacterium]|nr:response regulator [Deltaproteobacteria bacterium]
MKGKNPQNISTKELEKKIEEIKKQKILKNKIVSLTDYRKATNPHYILVVDDDQSTRHAVKRIFEKDGFEVLEATDGTELVRILEAHPLDAILLDIKLPWVDGYDLCKLIKQHDEFKNVPLVFLSGKTSEIEIKKGFEAGCDEYVTKPFEVADITTKVKNLINKS